MFTYIIFEIFGYLLLLAAVIWVLIRLHAFAHLRRKILTMPRATWGIIVLVFAGGIFIYIAAYPYPIHFALPPHMQTKAPHGPTAALPFSKIIEFFTSVRHFERVDDIGADPYAVPPVITRNYEDVVDITLEAKEVVSEVSEGVFFNYWTYNGQVPGPMLRVREGDTVRLTLKNHESSLHPHNIDLHSVTGPGGGAVLTNVQPGESKTFEWKALQPGLYVYHCATPNISTHNAHGQYGMILVEPKEGLPEVDHEFYVMQGELYTIGGLGKKGLVAFDAQAMLDGIPSYITFNGKVEDKPRMKVKTGDRVRIYVGNGGVNTISSFHVIGEIFDTVYPEAAIGSEPHKNIQTTTVLPGGASIVEYVADVAGNLILVDHALARMNKGAWAIMEVEGEYDTGIFKPIP